MVTRKAELMGTLVNRPGTTVVASAIAAVIIALNGYLIYSTIFG
jgi:manganese transport protein